MARLRNWLRAEPWKWNYPAIWRGIQGEHPWWRKLWWTITFPHVHDDDDE